MLQKQSLHHSINSWTSTGMLRKHFV